MGKEQLREQLARDTAIFLSQGGCIEEVPRRQVCPTTMPWALKRGFDYSPWDKAGSEGWCADQLSDVSEDIAPYGYHIAE
jgi:hypothetical protein